MCSERFGSCVTAAETEPLHRSNPFDTMRIKIFLLLTFILLAGTRLHAQDTIHVNSTAEIRIPAHQVRFDITITATERTPAQAFQSHKRQEAFLADLIRERKLDEGLLSFEPITLQQRYNRDEQQFQTRQQVRLRIDSLEQFEEIQMLLAEHQFEQFQASFHADGKEQALEEALRNAMKLAEEKAGLLAESAGRKLGQVHTIEHNTQSGPGPVYRMEALQMDSSSMLDFEASVPVSATVSVTYYLQ